MSNFTDNNFIRTKNLYSLVESIDVNGLDNFIKQNKQFSLTSKFIKKPPPFLMVKFFL